MAFASSLFCSSKFHELTHTLTKRLTVLTCSDNTKYTYPFRFRFLAHFTLMLEFFLCQNIGWRYRRGRKKKPHNSCFFFFFFFSSRFFAPPSEWRPRRPPIPPVGKTAPAFIPCHLILPSTFFTL